MVKEWIGKWVQHGEVEQLRHGERRASASDNRCPELDTPAGLVSSGATVVMSHPRR
jgi:hypothetical protein